MSLPKRKGKVGLAKAADASSTATVQVWPIYESANIEGVPNLSEQPNAQDRDVHNIQEHGFDFTWNIQGMAPSCFDFGYLLWLFLGSDTWDTDHHDIRPAEAAQYLNLKVGRGVDLDTGAKVTQNLVGAKVQSLSLEQRVNDYAKLNVSGPGCDLGTPETVLSPSFLSGANNAPLSWAGLAATSGGGFKIGYNGGAVAQDNAIRGIKLDLTQELEGAGIELDTEQPTALNEGARTLTFEVEREFKSGGARDDYDAWVAGQDIGVEICWTIGSSVMQLIIEEARITDNVPGEVGQGAEHITSTLKCKAFKNAASYLVDVQYTEPAGSAFT